MATKHADIVSADNCFGMNTNTGSSQPLLRCFQALTEREIQTLDLISKGFNNKNIARAFDVSESTIKSHVQNLLRKFNVRSRLELAVLSYRTECRGEAISGASVSGFASGSDDVWISISNAKFVINRSGCIVRHNKDWQLLMGRDTCGSMAVDNIHHRDKLEWEVLLIAIAGPAPTPHISNITFISSSGAELSLTLNFFVLDDEFYFVVEKVSSAVAYSNKLGGCRS
ncbi:TPA: response regulator transcription factor [Pseudomonas putida]